MALRRRRGPAATAAANAMKTARKRIAALERRARKEASAILKQARKDVQKIQKNLRATRKEILADVAKRAKRARKRFS